MLIEGLGLIGNRVHEQGPHANRPGGADHPEDGVAEQRRAEPTALPAPIDRQPSKQRDGTGSGILRRTRPVAASCNTEPAARL